MRDLESLFAIYTERRSALSSQHQKWRALASVYDGGLATPLPEYDEVSESAVPGLVTQGIDQYARRFAEVQPAVDSPAVRPNIASSRKKASERAMVFRGWWQHSYMPLVDYQRGRYQFGYGAMPVIIRSRADQPGIPQWEALSPMTVLPGPKPIDYAPEVPDAFLACTKSVAWLEQTFDLVFPQQVRRDMLVELVEYVDAEQCVVFCVGPASSSPPVFRNNGMYSRFQPFGSWAFEDWKPRRTKKGGWLTPIAAYPNYAGMCTVSHPGAISLSKVAGLVDNILGMHSLQAHLMSLTTKAIAKGIFPDVWAVMDPHGQGQIVKQADGLRGIVGEIQGGSIEAVQIQPGYQTWNLIDRLEANQRTTASIVPQMGGENPHNVRTGRASDTVAGFAVDPILSEAHTIAEIAREHENKIAVAVARGYGGSRQRSFYVAKPGVTKQRVDYSADDLFAETDETVVRYALAGADMQALGIMSQSSIGSGIMSTHRARVLSPLVEDPEAEAIAILAETAQNMLLSTFGEMLAASSPDDAALALRLIREGVPLEEVMRRVQQQAQQRQATAGEPGAPDGPSLPGSPEAQAGVAPEGVGAEVPPTIPEVPAGPANLAQLFGIAQRTRSAAGAA